MKSSGIALGIALFLLAVIGPLPAGAQQADAESDCIWDCILVQYWPGAPWHWKCVEGNVGMDCRQGEGWCSYVNCDSFAILDAAGGLKQFSVCAADVPALVEYAKSAGLKGQLDEYVRSGRVIVDDPAGNSRLGGGLRNSRHPRP